MADAPILRAKNMCKRYGAVQAVNNVSIDIYPGEVHALMGENGAGKSTISKLITGIETPDSGTIELEGKQVTIDTPLAAIEYGISIVMQEFNSIPHLPVYENIFLGHKEMYKGGVILDKRRAIHETLGLLALFGMEKQINPSSPLNMLSVAEQQIIEILKAVSYHSKIIFLDEPTASLTSKEVEKLFQVIRRLKAEGVAFVIISHRFNEIFEISDRITVLRDGNPIVEGDDMKAYDEQKLVKAMVGREITEFFGEHTERQGERKCMLKVENLCGAGGFLKDISFEAYSGEILGISGLVGAGRSELARCIFGADPYDSGQVYVENRPQPKSSPRKAIQAGIGFATENRKEEGLFLDLSILVNSVFAKTANGKGFVLPHRRENQDTLDMIQQLSIKVGHHRDPARSLSGGNQQKVVLSKWLLTNPKILILDEPTRGIDILAKSEIYTLIRSLVARGICVIIISSELPEILGICDRVLVMKDGVLVKDMPISQASEEIIMSYASFGKAVDQSTIEHEEVHS